MIVMQESTSHIVITRNEAVFEILSRIEKIASSDCTVLLIGETGAGKEVFAEYVHRIRARSFLMTLMISRENLLLKSDELTEQAYIPILQTERAKPTERTFEDRGMILETAVPILNENNEVYGIVYGGILLNQRFNLVDRIRSTVFGNDYIFNNVIFKKGRGKTK